MEKRESRALVFMCSAWPYLGGKGFDSFLQPPHVCRPFLLGENCKGIASFHFQVLLIVTHSAEGAMLSVPEKWNESKLAASGKGITENKEDSYTWSLVTIHSQQIKLCRMLCGCEPRSDRKAYIKHVTRVKGTLIKSRWLWLPTYSENWNPEKMELGDSSQALACIRLQGSIALCISFLSSVLDVDRAGVMCSLCYL